MAVQKYNSFIYREKFVTLHQKTYLSSNPQPIGFRGNLLVK